MNTSCTLVSAPRGAVVHSCRSRCSRSIRPLRAMASSEPANTTRADSGPSTVTVEYQRQQAKAMQAYLRNKTLQQEIVDAQVFGWTRKNEISNGRWVMMGLAIGMLTEYATGVSFIDQIKLMVSYLGIVDVE